MNQYLKILEENRKALLDMTQHLSTEQLNLIPTGYKNNIIWNMGHLITVSENILYKNSDIIRPVHQFEIALFGRNTKPDRLFSAADISLIKNALLNTVTAFGNHVVSGEALQFLLFHEDMHYRTIERLMRNIIIKLDD